MKKTLSALALILASSSSFAANMECMVDTAGWDQWGEGYCFGMEFTFDRAPNDATWRITNLNKTISSVIWSEATQGCSSTATYCTKSIPPYAEFVGKATILYADGTWENVQATASFETGH